MQENEQTPDDESHDGAFVALCHMITGMTGSEAVILLTDPGGDAPINVGMTFKPGYDRLEQVIDSLERIAANLRENAGQIKAASQTIKAMEQAADPDTVKH